MADNKKSSGLTVDLKLDLDMTETLTGLKAVQREAKKATQAIRELETMYGTDEGRFYVKWNQDKEDNCTDIQTTKLSDIPTKYLQRELSKREGVKTYTVLPHGEVAELSIDNGFEGFTEVIKGSAIITVNKD